VLGLHCINLIPTFVVTLMVTNAASCVIYIVTGPMERHVLAVGVD
jgi:hypothetical protein